jgi:hypothetical protein
VPYSYQVFVVPTDVGPREFPFWKLLPLLLRTQQQPPCRRWEGVDSDCTVRIHPPRWEILDEMKFGPKQVFFLHEIFSVISGKNISGSKTKGPKMRNIWFGELEGQGWVVIGASGGPTAFRSCKEKACLIIYLVFI